MFNSAWQWYLTSGLSHSTTSIEGMEIVVLLFILTICMLFQLCRTGLVTAYIFTYRWGLFFGEQHCVAKNTPFCNFFFTGYIVFGILVLTLAVVAMMIAARSGR